MKTERSPCDARGIRATAGPFTFLARFFLIDSFVMPVVAFAPPHGPPPASPLIARGA